MKFVDDDDDDDGVTILIDYCYLLTDQRNKVIILEELKTMNRSVNKRL